MGTLVGWPVVTDDNGDGQSGTVFRKALTDEIKESVEYGMFGGVTPVFPFETTLEMESARGSQPTLHDRLSVALAADGSLNPLQPQPAFYPGAALVADGTVGGGVHALISSVANSGVSNTVLGSYTVQANHFNVNGKTIQFEAFGIYAANANTKILDVQVGGVSFGTFSTTISGANWYIQGTLSRSAAATGALLVRFESGPTTDNPITDNRLITSVAVAQVWTNSCALQVLGQGLASGDIVLHSIIVRAVN